jgi:hypothetical protein
MKEDQKRDLAKILDVYDGRVEAARKREAAQQAQRESFLDSFRALRQQVIRPIMEEFVGVLEAKGHVVRISETEDSGMNDATVAGIALLVAPKSLTGKPDPPRLVDSPTGHVGTRFLCDKPRRKIRVYASTLSMAGDRGAYDIEQFDADFVANHILQTLSEGLAK